MTEIDRYLPCGCAIHKSGARVYCESCDAELHEAVAYQPKPEDFDFPMNVSLSSVRELSRPDYTEHGGMAELDPHLTYLETRLGNLEGQANYFTGKLLTHLAATTKKGKDAW